VENKVEDIVSFFFQHVVPIKFILEKDKQKVTKFITAFVMSVDDHWLLVTAGHCLHIINEALDQGAKIVETQLIDYLGIEAKDEHPIPFVYGQASVHYYYEQGEFDYGFIPLSEYYVLLLEKNNVRPFNEETWKKQPSSPIAYLLLGLPDILEQKDAKGVSIAPTMLFVNKVEEKPEGFKKSDFPFFYGNVLLPNGLEEIKGMSGGPLLAIQEDKEGHFRYWITALQSAWLSNSHSIKACPTYLLGEYIESILKNDTPYAKTLTNN
jgi:hypothetical protein